MRRRAVIDSPAAFPSETDFPGQPHRAAYDADVTFSLFSMAMNILCGEEA